MEPLKYEELRRAIEQDGEPHARLHCNDSRDERKMRATGEADELSRVGQQREADRDRR